MREKAANPPAASPTLLCSVPCRYTALQSATVPPPKSAQKAMKPSRSKSPEGLKMARPLPLLISVLPGNNQRAAPRAALIVTTATRQKWKSGATPKEASRPPHTAPSNPPPLNAAWNDVWRRSEEHTSELQSLAYLVCRLLLEKKKNIQQLSQLRRSDDTASLSVLRS